MPLYCAKAGLNLKVMQFSFDWLGHTTSKIQYMLSRLSCLNCSVDYPHLAVKTRRLETDELYLLLIFIVFTRTKLMPFGRSRYVVSKCKENITKRHPNSRKIGAYLMLLVLLVI